MTGRKRLTVLAALAEHAEDIKIILNFVTSPMTPFPRSPLDFLERRVYNLFHIHTHAVTHTHTRTHGHTHTHTHKHARTHARTHDTRKTHAHTDTHTHTHTHVTFTHLHTNFTSSLIVTFQSSVQLFFSTSSTSTSTLLALSPKLLQPLNNVGYARARHNIPPPPPPHTHTLQAPAFLARTPTTDFMIPNLFKLTAP